MKNRVEQEWLNILKGFADTYWEKEMDEAKNLFDTPYPDRSDKDFIKKTTFLDNSKRSKLQMLKYLAQASSGAVHPTGTNSKEEKTQVCGLLLKVLKKVSQT